MQLTLHWCELQSDYISCCNRLQEKVLFELKSHLVTESPCATLTRLHSQQYQLARPQITE